jgi:uncharacterized membrane protein
MPPELQILLWWILFGGTHILGSMVPVRSFLIRKLTLYGFKTLYSLVSFATIIPLCRVYFTHKHAGTVLFTPPLWLGIGAQILVFGGLFFLIQGLLTPNPATTLAELTGKFGAGARGVQRITRQPQNLGWALFGLGHLLANPWVGDWIFFGGLLVFCVVSSLHQDARMRATGPEAVERYMEQTSLVPFAAILTGRQRLALMEFSLVGLVAWAVAASLLRYFHPTLIGGFGG